MQKPKKKRLKKNTNLNTCSLIDKKTESCMTEINRHTYTKIERQIDR